MPRNSDAFPGHKPNGILDIATVRLKRLQLVSRIVATV